jgi:hypothetical protein
MNSSNHKDAGRSGEFATLALLTAIFTTIGLVARFF